MVPSTMTAMTLPEFGGPDVLRVAQVRCAAPDRGEVLVRVGAVSVGRTLDLATRAGEQPFAGLVSLPHILGADHAGTVVATGPEVEECSVGDRVAAFPVMVCGYCAGCRSDRADICTRLELLGIHRQGAYAEFCIVPAESLHVVPDDVSDEQAAALALNGPVALRQLTETGARPGDWVLISAAAGALGSALVALATHLGFRVVAVTRHRWKDALLQDFGAELVVDPLDPASAQRIDEASDGYGVRAIVDNVADPRTWSAALELLKPGGTVVCSGTLSGAEVALDLRRMYLRSQTVRTVRTARPSDAVALWKEVAGGFRVPVDPHRFTLEQAAAAHQHVQSGASTGRVVLSVG